MGGCYGFRVSRSSQMQGSAYIRNRCARVSTPSKHSSPHKSSIYIKTHCTSSLILGLHVDNQGNTLFLGISDPARWPLQLEVHSSSHTCIQRGLPSSWSLSSCWSLVPCPSDPQFLITDWHSDLLCYLLACQPCGSIVFAHTGSE